MISIVVVFKYVADFKAVKNKELWKAIEAIHDLILSSKRNEINDTI